MERVGLPFRTLLMAESISRKREGQEGLKEEIFFPGVFYVIASYLKCSGNQHKILLLPNTNPLLKEVLIF